MDVARPKPSGIALPTIAARAVVVAIGSS